MSTYQCETELIETVGRAEIVYRCQQLATLVVTSMCEAMSDNKITNYVCLDHVDIARNTKGLICSNGHPVHLLCIKPI